ncbi:hypothetical protein DH2020_007789 [Rehmannia glutinosa]|uniref:Uncharacterized protein n=1 Tax=Rehmannia glutinosa TaxID=99300 RepID=A0ABR0TZ48_REHGL
MIGTSESVPETESEPSITTDDDTSVQTDVETPATAPVNTHVPTDSEIESELESEQNQLLFDLVMGFVESKMSHALPYPSLIYMILNSQGLNMWNNDTFSPEPELFTISHYLFKGDREIDLPFKFPGEEDDIEVVPPITLAKEHMQDYENYKVHMQSMLLPLLGQKIGEVVDNGGAGIGSGPSTTGGRASSSGAKSGVDDL